MRRSTINWIIIGIVGVIATSIFVFFSIASEPYTSARSQANKIAYKSADIDNPNYFSNFTQDNQYYSVGGWTKENKYRYVMINAKSGKIKILKSNKYNRETTKNKILSKYNPKRINDINLGIIHNKPTWEVSFTNKNNSIGYAMVDYETNKITQLINNI
ncbi:hypothetical protein RD055328_06050 [Companilactobacillus sp. RD055328]|uniref:hypothetical protein n=1 Tax=Companilactobacillus sp. RD055328 TaxID=2916634 RepID=UPI001FC861E1|nr:hypothetical protein [Companilactobacillus sp. RD055328]GKQ42682.1 hypothetical protein RD055328_06050 [Companilactobacillus sp. RD055328]